MKDKAISLDVLFVEATTNELAIDAADEVRRLNPDRTMAVFALPLGAKYKFKFREIEPITAETEGE